VSCLSASCSIWGIVILPSKSVFVHYYFLKTNGWGGGAIFIGFVSRCLSADGFKIDYIVNPEFSFKFKDRETGIPVAGNGDFGIVTCICVGSLSRMNF